MNSFLYDVIKDFNNLSGIPIILNTWFNLRNELIVEDIEGALIIPDPFLFKWEKKNLKNLNYLQDNDYYVRKFYYINDKLINNSNKNQPLIDTRNLNKDKSGKIELIAERFINIISKFPRIKEKIIFSLPNKFPSIILAYLFIISAIWEPQLTVIT